jgi:O-antigen/teichoic acid export membrane protein
MRQPGAFLLRGSLGTGAVQIVSIGLTFGSSVVLARLLGESGFGTYSYALTWSLLVLGPATAGFGPVVTRETAAGVETRAWDRVLGVGQYARKLTALATALVVGAGLPLVLLSSRWLGEDQVQALLVGILITVLGAALLIVRHRLLGLRRVVVAQFAESVLRPALLLLLVGLAAWAGAPLREGSGAALALALYAVASLGTLLFVLWRADAASPGELADAVPITDPGWLRSAWPLLLTGLARDLNAEAGVLLMGSTLSPVDVGLFRAAQRLASLPTYVLTAINLSFQPVAAGLFAKGDTRAIEILGVRASRISVLLSLPFLVAFWLWGDWLLGWFGPGFVRAKLALLILAAGHLFNVACGPVGVVLVATKREDDAAKGLILSCFVTLLATAIGVRVAGLEGAAVATALGLVVWNVALSWFTWERLGILPAAFSWRWLRW